MNGIPAIKEQLEVGRWLARLEANRRENRLAAPGEQTDKTDKTSPNRVSSVLSVADTVISTQIRPRDSVGFVSTTEARKGAEWSSEDWRAFFDERAAIAEYDGGLFGTELPEGDWMGFARAWALNCSIALRSSVHASNPRRGGVSRSRAGGSVFTREGRPDDRRCAEASLNWTPFVGPRVVEFKV
jgi:hypothetical protein